MHIKALTEGDSPAIFDNFEDVAGLLERARGRVNQQQQTSIRRTMATNYTAAETTTIANEILRAYPVTALRAGHAGFTWRRSVLPGAWTSRVNLVAPLVSATHSRAMPAVLQAADDVYKWGFGGKSIPAKISRNAGFPTALLDTLTAFEGSTPQHIAAREPSLAALLSIGGLGIATASKWICFLNQGRFGIFDSRVSIAFRSIHVTGDRAFPIVGRRKLANRTAFRPDGQVVSASQRMARAYLDYLVVLSEVARLTSMQPAEVEMALFMIGDVWANGHPPLRPLRHSMWT